MSVTRNPKLGPSLIRARKRRLFLIRFFIVSFFTLVIIFSLAIFSDHEKIRIQTINVSGNAAVQSDAILEVVDKSLTGRYWHLFSKRNFLIFPRFQINDNLLNDFKTIKEVNVSWGDWQTISIDIIERKPHSVWCGLTPPNSSANNLAVSEVECFFMDKTGLIYSLAPTFSGNMFVRGYGLYDKINKIATSTNLIGQYFLPSSQYVKIFNLIDNLEKNNIKVASVFFDDFDYIFTLEGGITVIFNEKNDFNISFSNFFTALETKNIDLTKETSDINYIDLRFDNKIIIGKNFLK